MAKKTSEPVRQRVHSPRVSAGPCPRNETHENTRVYKTKGRVRHCKCNDCGETWKVTGDFADDLKNFVMELADELDSSERIDGDGGKVIVLSDETAKQISSDLRDYVELT